MPRQAQPTLARRAPKQIDLFAGELRTIGGMPAWSGLPTETRAALMTRLILDHANKSRIGSMTEAGHDL